MAGSPFTLLLVDNRGTQVYPSTGGAPSDSVDLWRCRYLTANGDAATDPALLDLIARTATVAPWVHIEKLQRFDGVDGFTKAQGQS